MNISPRSQMPKGVPTFLPGAAAEKRALEATLFSVFAERGYREVIPPTFEYLDVLAPGLDAELIEKSYKVVDRATGRILVLRPDATAQIARMVGMGMLDSGFPLRLHYSVNVFRYEPEHAGARSSWQPSACGVWQCRGSRLRLVMAGFFKASCVV